MRDQERHANESKEQREIRLSRLCQRDHETRGTETDEQRAQRNQRMREYMRQLRSNETPPAPSPERARQLEFLRKDLKTFHKEIRQSPTSTCCTCDRLCYPKGTSLIDVGKVHDVLQQHYRFAMNDPQVSSLLPIEDSVRSVCVCSRCMAFIKKGKLPPFSSINNMKVDAVPPELTRLNTMEQRLIARVQALMKLIVLPLGQRALAGQTINFPVNVSEVCNSLPRPLNSDGIVLVKPPESNTVSVSDPRQPTTNTSNSEPSTTSVSTGANGSRTNTRNACRNVFVVRKPLIVSALRWLKQNNSLYSDVSIDASVINQEDCCSASDAVPTSSTDPPQFECAVVRTDFNLPNVETIDVIRQGGAFHQVHQLSRVHGQPISLYDDNSAEEMAFPCLFPNGINGLHTARDPAITFLDYIQARLLNVDNRWASHITYLLWSCNLLEQMKLRDSVSVAMRIRSSSGGSSTGCDGRLTAGQLLNDDLSENPELSDNCYAFMRNIRGTAAYWQRAKLDLFAMFRKLGPPTYFITLSADDMNWFDLMCVLSNCDGMSLDDDQVKELSPGERSRLLCSYPVIVAQHFSHRFNAFVNHILKGDSKSIGEVVDFFWRVEFQQRGLPHVHSLWWVKDAPNLQTVDGKRMAPGFIDKHITCRVPKEGEDDELRQLVLRVQRHSHMSTCHKEGQSRCQFDYPKQSSETTHLKGNADVGNKARFYILKRDKGAEYINPYNPDLLRAWQANMDIQMVGSVYGAAKYVCHYMCKDEPQELKQLISRKLDELPDGCNQRQRLLKIGNTLISHRILSAQEAVYRTTGLHLRGSTRSSILVNTARPEKRTCILKSRLQLRAMSTEDDDIFQTGLFKRYAARPDGEPFDNMSLAHFAVWYNVAKAGEQPSTSRAQPRYQLKNDQGLIYLRRKQACLRVPTVTQESHVTTTITIYSCCISRGETSL